MAWHPGSWCFSFAWPEAFEHNCTIAWGFLGTVISKWGWLKLAFGNEVECRVGITAYYQLMSFLNFVALAKTGRLDEPPERFPITVPLDFAIWPRESGDKGYLLFLKIEGVLRRILESNNLDHAALESFWPKWLAMVGNWLASVYLRFWPSFYIPQSKFPQDLKKDPYLVG
jgi:hypothetical protein